MHDDSRKMSVEKHRLKMRGSRVSTLLGKSLFQDSTQMKNTMHNVILSVDTSGNAIHKDHVEEHKSVDDSNIVKSSGISRLRQKRLLNCNNQVKRGLCRNGLDMMTSKDRQYIRGDSSDAAFMPRSVGLLPYAEHYGSLG
uniref:Uncharacterized protein n=1 Tax=Eucampia antarctica TaxID=49252 RepID=A0A7S2R882_9STRA|mmetsp:Transcript_18562/g.17876  ORF Transcript_18562/g.17876 Transcript_18562/m.17876 type:complete len:140 (+) Transcript_18562:3-422(+)